MEDGIKLIFLLEIEVFFLPVFYFFYLHRLDVLVGMLQYSPMTALMCPITFKNESLSSLVLFFEVE